MKGHFGHFKMMVIRTLEESIDFRNRLKYWVQELRVRAVMRSEIV